MIAWRSVYGQWLASPMPTAHNWTRPVLFRVLLTQDRGLFSWTPLVFLAFLATLALAVKGLWQTLTRRGEGRAGDAPLNPPLVLLLAAFALQVYVLACLFGAQVTLSVSFGFRYLTEVLVALVPGLALLLEQAPKRAGRLLVGVGCLLVLWNLVLISQYRYGWIPADAGADLSTLLANTWRLAWRKKFLFVQQAVLGPLLLAALGRVLKPFPGCGAVGVAGARWGGRLPGGGERLHQRRCARPVQTVARQRVAAHGAAGSAEEDGNWPGGTHTTAHGRGGNPAAGSIKDS